MSFSMDRILICSGCKKRVVASELKFPADLHDTLMRLHIPHLHWICPSCEDKFGLFSSKYNYQKQELFKKDPAINLKTIEIVFDKTEDEKGNFSSCSLNDFENSEELDEINNDFGDLGTPLGLSEASSKRNKAANTIVNEILKTEVKIDKAQLLKSKSIFTSFINDYLIPFFQKDEIFSEVYQRIYYTGSSYNDLKISQADEYDVNIVLNFSKQIDIMPEFFESTSMFAKLIWKATEITPTGFVSKFLEKFSEFNAFNPLKIASWLQSLIDKFIISNPEIPDVVKVKPFQSGPARTVQLDTIYGYSICIDLVPVFQFDYSYLKHLTILNDYPVEESKQFWFLVPKPCRGEQRMYAHEMSLSWRVHLPEAEKAVLYNKQCAKPVIKLLKLLRDKQNWKSYLSSYHCKTVVLWELRKNPDSQYWSEKLLYERFLEALKSLIAYYLEKKLPYFFDENYDLFHQMTAKQASNICSRLSRIVKDMEKDPGNLKEYFKFNVKSIETF